MIPWHQADRELDVVSRRQLGKAHDGAFDRYRHYRAKGHSIEDSFSYALAWGRNLTEQKARRAGHGTGFTWRT